jgi:hypothetical protein
MRRRMRASTATRSGRRTRPVPGRLELLQLSGLAAGLSDRGGAAVAGLGQVATADPARTARWLLPIPADQSENPRPPPRDAPRRRGSW